MPYIRERMCLSLLLWVRFRELESSSVFIHTTCENYERNITVLIKTKAYTVIHGYFPRRQTTHRLIRTILNMNISPPMRPSPMHIAQCAYNNNNIRTRTIQLYRFLICCTRRRISHDSASFRRSHIAAVLFYALLCQRIYDTNCTQSKDGINKSKTYYYYTHSLSHSYGWAWCSCAASCSCMQREHNERTHILSGDITNMIWLFFDSHLCIYGRDVCV